VTRTEKTTIDAQGNKKVEVTEETGEAQPKQLETNKRHTYASNNYDNDEYDRNQRKKNSLK
jgi:hypothetical protein